MPRHNKFWTPDSLIIVLTRNRPRTLGRCLKNALKTGGNNNSLIVLDDSGRQYMRRNRAIILESVRTQDAVVHLTTRDCFTTLTNCLSASALKWSKKTARRDIAPIRNVSLLLSLCFGAKYVLFIDDDITEFDLRITQHWMEKLGERHRSVVAGAHIGGIDETDTISRLEDGIQRACICEDNSRLLGVRESFTVLSQCVSDVVQADFVSGGYMSFRFATDIPEPFPPGYNEDWLWCLSLRYQNKATVYKLPQVVTHAPVVLRRPNNNDLLFEGRGDLVLKNEMAHRVSREGVNATKLTDESADPMGDGDFDRPDIRADMLLQEINRHQDRCASHMIEMFGPFGLETLKRLASERTLNRDWDREFQQWEKQTMSNRDSFREVLESKFVDKLSELVEKGRLRNGNHASV